MRGGAASLPVLAAADRRIAEVGRETRPDQGRLPRDDGREDDPVTVESASSSSSSSPGSDDSSMTAAADLRSRVVADPDAAAVTAEMRGTTGGLLLLWAPRCRWTAVAEESDRCMLLPDCSGSAC